MSDIQTFSTRLIGAEDLFFDVNGLGETFTFTDYGGIQHELRKINASHIPITVNVRNVFSGVQTVEDAILALNAKIGTGSSSEMTEDTVIQLEAGAESGWNDAIAACSKNLGGHKLTVKFPLTDSILSEHIVFSQFHNGELVVDLNEATLGESSNIYYLLGFHDCSCTCEVTNGILRHEHTTYGIYFQSCHSFYLHNIQSYGKNSSTSYLVYSVSSLGYFEDIFPNNDERIFISAIYSDYTDSAVSAHNSNASAHSSLFNAKAPKASPSFTGTPTCPTPVSGSSNTQIANTGWVQHLVRGSRAGVVSSVSGKTGAVTLEESDINGLANDLSSINAELDTLGDAIAETAPKASPAFTGTPTCPNLSDDSSDSQIVNRKSVRDMIPQSFETSRLVNGYQKFPSGIIIQWGTASATTNAQSFPIAFPNACFAICQAGTSSWNRGQKIVIENLSQYRITADNPESTTWIAIGF